MIGREDIAIEEHEKLAKTKKERKELQPGTENMAEKRLGQADNMVANLEQTGLPVVLNMAKEQSEAVDKKTKTGLALVAEKAKTAYSCFEGKVSEYVDTKLRIRESISVARHIAKLAKGGKLDEALELYDKNADEIDYLTGKTGSGRSVDSIWWHAKMNIYSALDRYFYEKKEEGAGGFEQDVVLYRRLVEFKGYGESFSDPNRRYGSTNYILKRLWESALKKVKLENPGKEKEWDDQMREQFYQLLLKNAPAVYLSEHGRYGSYVSSKERILEASEAVVTDGRDRSILRKLSMSQFPEEISVKVKAELFWQYNDAEQFDQILSRFDSFTDNFDTLPEDEKINFARRMERRFKPDSISYISFNLYDVLKKGKIKADWFSSDFRTELSKCIVPGLIGRVDSDVDKLDEVVQSLGIDSETKNKIINIAYTSLFNVYGHSLKSAGEEILDRCQELAERYDVEPDVGIIGDIVLEAILSNQKDLALSFARANSNFKDKTERQIMDELQFNTGAVVQNFNLENYRVLLSPENYQLLEKAVSRYAEPLSGSPNDKVRPYLIYLVEQDCGFDLSRSGLQDFGTFVEKFGLEQTPRLYRYFSNLQKLNRGEIVSLPAEQVQDRMTSIDELEKRLSQIKEDLIAGQIPSPEKMTPFDYDVLAVGTMFNSSRWARRDKKLPELHRQFVEAQRRKEIEGLPEGYEPVMLKVERVKNNLDSLNRPEVVGEYKRFRADLIGAEDLQKNGGLARMRTEISELLRKELSALDLSTDNDAKRKAMTKKADILQAGLADVQRGSSADEVLQVLLKMEDGLNIKKENAFTSPYMRRILFSKAMIHHSGFEQLPVPMQNNDEVYLEGAQYVRDITMNVLKDHVLSGTKKEMKKYFGDWNPATQDFGRLKKILSMNNIVETMQRMEASLEGSQEEIAMIPDRGFVGELSGYYSEACYTGIDEMLKKWPEAVPCKFVINPKDPKKRQIIGGVILIEREGKMIVRANNPRDEFLNRLQASSFCEQVYTAAARIAKKRKLKSVLVTGVPGTTSNREKINSYVRSQFKEDRVVPLRASLNFNSYEIKDGCYEVRKVA